MKFQRIIWAPTSVTLHSDTPHSRGSSTTHESRKDFRSPPGSPSNPCQLEPMVQGQSYGWNRPGLNKTKPKGQQQGQEQPRPAESPSAVPTP